MPSSSPVRFSANYLFGNRYPYCLKLDDNNRSPVQLSTYYYRQTLPDKRAKSSTKNTNNATSRLSSPCRQTMSRFRHLDLRN